MPTLPSPRVAGLDLRVDADHRAARVEQRAAGVAVVDRGVGLDHVVDRVAVRRLDCALEGADDARRDGAVEAERVADRDDRVADLRPGRSRRAGAASARAGRASTLSTARSVDGSLPTSVAFERVVVREADLDRGRALDDVVVRDDVPFLVEHEARAERLSAPASRTACRRTGRSGPRDFPVDTICTTPGALRR